MRARYAHFGAGHMLRAIVCHCASFPTTDTSPSRIGSGAPAERTALERQRMLQ